MEIHPLSYIRECLDVLEPVRASFEAVCHRRSRICQHTGSFRWASIPAFATTWPPCRLIHVEFAGNTAHFCFGHLEQHDGGRITFVSRQQRNMYIHIYNDVIWIRPYRSLLSLNRHWDTEVPIGPFSFRPPNPTELTLEMPTP